MNEKAGFLDGLSDEKKEAYLFEHIAKLEEGSPQSSTPPVANIQI